MRTTLSDPHHGRYWSSTVQDATYAHHMNFGSDYLFPASNGSRYGGLSVRLVRAAE